MVLFIIFCPIVAAILIMSARLRARRAGCVGFNVCGGVVSVSRLSTRVKHDFQHVTSFTISPEWRLSFTTGVDGLSLVMVLLAAIVTLAAVWFAGTIERYENAFYACLLFISGGAIGAFASIDLFFFYAFHELALIPTFLLIGIWGSGNRVAAAWKITIYLAIGSFILLLGLILLYQSFPAASRSFDIRALHDCGRHGPDPAGRATPCLSAAAYRFRNSRFALSVSHLGAGSVRVRAGAGGDVARGRVEKIWALRSVASGRSAAAGRRASLDRLCSSCCCSATSFTSGWSRSRRSGSIGCSVIRA